MVDTPQSAALLSSLYRVIWRWHFFAGLLILPFLAMMAVTGGAYLFRPELDHWIYRELENVPARAHPHAKASEIIARVESSLNARVIEFTPSTAPTQAVRLLVRGSAGEPLTAFADPYDGRVTGSTAYGGVMQLVRKIHSLQKFGFWASCLIELTAGWTIVLIGTGVFLWWPRKSGTGGVVTVRGSPKHRVFWRDLHAVTGISAGSLVLFLAVTGMPWSMFWGDHVQKWATAANLSEPAPPAAVTPSWAMTATMPDMPHTPHAMGTPISPDMPWAMEKMHSPSSDDASHKAPIDVDEAAATFARLGLDPSASIALPEGPKGAYVASWRPDRVQDTRAVYLDQYTGAVLGDVGFKDWGPAGKTIEWGISVHQGQEYGPINRYLMLLACLALLVTCISAATMWWMRRPAGTLGIPPPPVHAGAAKGFLAILIGVGVLFPLVGASILAALGIDLVQQATRRAMSP